MDTLGLHIVAGVMLMAGWLCFVVALCQLAPPEPDGKVSEEWRRRNGEGE